MKMEGIYRVPFEIKIYVNYFAIYICNLNITKKMVACEVSKDICAHVKKN